MYIGVHVKIPVILVRFQSNLNFLHLFWKKNSNIRFNEDTTSGSRVGSCGRTDRHDEAFRNYTNAPKSDTHHWLPVLPASQPNNARPTKQNCRFLAEGIVSWQNFVYLRNTSQNHGKIGIYRTMRTNFSRLHTTTIKMSQSAIQRLIQKNVIVNACISLFQ